MAQRTSLRVLLANASKPGYLAVMAEKVWMRVHERGRKAEAEASVSWCSERAESMEAFGREIAPALWEEAVAFDSAARTATASKLASIGIDLGGGADCRLLYLLSRHLRPATVVETGVAAGHSSNCILHALRTNGSGRLLSSDFPYFRLENPERYVGVLVDDELRKDWTLLIEGDRKNLPKIAAAIRHIDLLHYDSDKSRAGRKMAMRVLAERLSERSVVVMDDIQDNLFFRDYAQQQRRRWRVFASGGKFVGLVGL